MIYKLIILLNCFLTFDLFAHRAFCQDNNFVFEISVTTNGIRDNTSFLYPNIYGVESSCGEHVYTRDTLFTSGSFDFENSIYITFIYESFENELDLMTDLTFDCVKLFPDSTLVVYSIIDNSVPLFSLSKSGVLTLDKKLIESQIDPSKTSYKKETRTGNYIFEENYEICFIQNCVARKEKYDFPCE